MMQLAASSTPTPLRPCPRPLVPADRWTAASERHDRALATFDGARFERTVAVEVVLTRPADEDPVPALPPGGAALVMTYERRPQGAAVVPTTRVYRLQTSPARELASCVRWTERDVQDLLPRDRRDAVASAPAADGTSLRKGLRTIAVSRSPDGRWLSLYDPRRGEYRVPWRAAWYRGELVQRTVDVAFGGLVFAALISVRTPTPEAPRRAV